MPACSCSQRVQGNEAKKSLSHWRDEVPCLTNRNCKDRGRGTSELSWWAELPWGSQQLLPLSSASLPDYPSSPMSHRPVSCNLFQTTLIFQLLSPTLIVLVFRSCLVVQERDLSHWLPYNCSTEMEKSNLTLIISTELPFAGDLPWARHCSG